jgi:hypothetical protein
MDKAKAQTIGIALAAAVVVGAGSYWWAARAHTPPIVAISQTACGIPAVSASFGVPLATLRESAPRIGVSFGPIEAPQAGGPLRLMFDPAADGRGREVKLIGETLHLPVAFGRDDARPERITITCRDGQLANVRYQAGTRSSATFNVVREDIARLLEGTAGG